MSEQLKGVVSPKKQITGQLVRAEYVGGTRDYNVLENKPRIEGEELVGDKSLADLHIDRYLPTRTSQLLNDSGYQTAAQVAEKIATSVPHNTSDLTNDSDFQTSTDVGAAITEAVEKLDIPKATSDLLNDSDFQTGTEVNAAIADAVRDLDIPTKTSDLTNDSGYQTASQVATAINSAVGDLDIPTKTSDLVNDSTYQTLSEINALINAALQNLDMPTKLSDLTNDMTFQTLAQITALINNAIGEVTGLSYEVVAELPATGKAGTIYLVPNGSLLARNIYNEYIWYNNNFELIGSTELDLSGYIKEEDIDSELSTTSEMPVQNKVVKAALDDKVDKVTGKGLSTNDYSNADKAIVDGVTAALAGKADAGDVPTALSDLTDDATHRLVTDTEKATWNGKADSSDIPTGLADLTDDSTHRLVSDTEKATWNGKADASDIPTDLADLTADSTHRTVTDAEKSAWNNKADSADIPTKTSDLTNDSGFATTTDLSGKEDLFRFSTMPTASADNVGDIVQFTGTTTASYTTGYFYKCVEESGSYSWVQTDVQPSSGGGGASESEIAPVESTSTASKAYAINDLLIYNGHLYRVTAAIANGGTITPGTNVAETSVSEVFVRKTGDTMTGQLKTTRLTVGATMAGYGPDGSNAATFGSYTKAISSNQLVAGRFNNNSVDNVFELGNGSSRGSESNAFEVSWTGDVKAAGDITDGQGNTLKGANGNLATIETTTTASQAYGVGDYLVYGGQLYKVTTAIANGGTITTTGSSANVAATTVILAINDMVGLALTASY